MTAPGPRLSACILTRDSATRLPSLLDEVGLFADEVVVGVDDSSTDGTVEAARGAADVVFRFGHTAGGADPARMLVLDHCTGAWVLVLDDDESIDQRFISLRDELLEDNRYTHYWMPRKWMASEEPPTYLRAWPWFPDWQLRLFRNDRRLVRHSARTHETYRVIGPGCHEDRTSILHFERLILPESARKEKVAGYRRLQGTERYERFYESIEGVRTEPLESPRADAGGSRRARPTRVVGPVQAIYPHPFPGWQAYLQVRMPDHVRADERVVAEVTASNPGPLRWVPPSNAWPRLFISYHVRDSAGRVIVWDGERSPIGRIVDPGETGRFFAAFVAPSEAGELVVEWDVVSEEECWFAEEGSRTAQVKLTVSGLRKRRLGTWRRGAEV